MKKIRLVFFAVLPILATTDLYAACNWGSLGPGEWCEVPDTKLEDSVTIGGQYSLSDGKVALDCDGNGERRRLLNIMKAWSGGAYDSDRQKLIVFGGGHADYCGNELYEFDVNSFAWEQVTLPDLDVTSGSVCETSLGRPKSPHTYDYPVYVPEPHRGQFCTGLEACYPGSAEVAVLWCNDPDGRANSNNSGTEGWYKVMEPTPYGHDKYHTAYYDGNVYIDANDKYLWVWDAATTSVQRTGPGDGPAVMDADMDGEIDPIRERMYVFGDGKFYVWDLNTGVKSDGLASVPSGCSFKAPGWEWDDSIGKFVAWCGGSKTHTYDPSSDTWNTCSAASGSPTSPQNNGTYDRFKYVPHRNGYVLVNATRENVFLYRLPESCGGASTPTPKPPTELKTQ